MRPKWLLDLGAALLDVCAAILLPFVIIGAVVAIDHRSSLGLPLFMVISLLAQIIGFAFLGRRFKLWAIPLAIPYFALMYPALFRFGLVATCALFDRCL